MKQIAIIIVIIYQVCIINKKRTKNKATTNMATEYIKTWPDLMAGKKVLYVHGFASSGQSGTVTLLKTILPKAEVIAPDLPLPPFEAIELLHEVCRSESPDLIIGSSMGE